MTKLSIDGQVTEKDENLLFGDLIKGISNDSKNSKKVISEIFINRKFIDENMEQHIALKRIGELGGIEIGLSDPIELAYEALDSASLYITKMIPRCSEAGLLFKEERIPEANKYFLSLIDSLDNLSKLILSAQAVLREQIKGARVNDSSLRVAQIRLVSAVQELYPARKNEDWVMLADILINELPDALKEMRDLGIPVLKRIRTS